MGMSFKYFVIGAGLIGLGYLIHENIMTDKMRSEIAKNVHIPENVVQKAIEKAASKSVDAQIDRAMRKAMDSVEVSLRDMVKAAVVQKYGDMAEPISQQIAISVAKVDTDLVQKAAIEAAKKSILEKFDDCLDDILEEVKDKISSADVDDIISAAMTKSKAQCVFKIV